MSAASGRFGETPHPGGHGRGVAPLLHVNIRQRVQDVRPQRAGVEQGVLRQRFGFGQAAMPREGDHGQVIGGAGMMRGGFKGFPVGVFGGVQLVVRVINVAQGQPAFGAVGAAADGRLVLGGGLLAQALRLVRRAQAEMFLRGKRIGAGAQAGRAGAGREKSQEDQQKSALRAELYRGCGG